MYALYTEMHSVGNILPSSSRKRIGIYCGKGRLTPLPDTIETYLSGAELLSVNRYWLKCRQEYNELMLSLDVLISYDPLTAVNLDVACQGKPVFLPNDPFDRQCYSQYPLKCLQNIYSLSDDFLSAVLQSVSVQPSIRGVLSDIYKANQETVAKLVKQPSIPHIYRIKETTVLVDQLKAYTTLLASVSTIQPSLDGQAASSRLLGVYLLYLQNHKLVQRLSKTTLHLLLSTSDTLMASKEGYCIVNKTISGWRRTCYYYVRLKAIILLIPHKIKSTLLSQARKYLLPPIH